MQPEQAEMIALQALGWLVGNDELREIFMGASGVSADDLRTRASDPAFLSSVLGFLTMDDAWVVSFCDSVGLQYEQPLQAQYALPGAEMVHWT